MFNLSNSIRISKYRHKIKFFFYLSKCILKLFNKYRIVYDYCDPCEKNTLKIYYPLKHYSDLSVCYNESGLCFSCGSSHRNRIIYKKIKNHIKGDVYLPSGDGFLFWKLKKYSSISFSDFYVKRTDVLASVPHQDLTNLTYDSGSFDLIISEHVMEHVNNPKKAFKEIHRVLKKNGMYIFTIPFEAKEKSLIRIDKNNNQFLPKKYHLDPIRKEGALVYNDFCKKDFLKKFIPKEFSSKVITEDVSIINNIKIISDVVILKK